MIFIIQVYRLPEISDVTKRSQRAEKWNINLILMSQANKIWFKIDKILVKIRKYWEIIIWKFHSSSISSPEFGVMLKRPENGQPINFLWINYWVSKPKYCQLRKKTNITFQWMIAMKHVLNLKKVKQINPSLSQLTRRTAHDISKCVFPFTVKDNSFLSNS